MKDLFEQYTEIASLAGGLAHEIKNPLSTIRLNLELLAEDLETWDSPTGRRAMNKLETMQRECARLEKFLNHFLHFARAHKLELTPGDINKEIRTIVDFHRPKWKEKHIEVIEYLDGNLPTVLLDSQSLHGALLNLFLNAEQAMPEGGTLAVRTRTIGGDQVAIDLIDSGCGMDAKTAENIFDAFYSTKRGGSGLGLPTTKKIIEAHGGKIFVLSEPNRGTQFTVTFPCLPRIPEDVRDKVKDKR